MGAGGPAGPRRLEPVPAVQASVGAGEWCPGPGLALLGSGQPPHPRFSNLLLFPRTKHLQACTRRPRTPPRPPTTPMSWRLSSRKVGELLSSRTRLLLVLRGHCGPGALGQALFTPASVSLCVHG